MPKSDKKVVKVTYSMDKEVSDLLDSYSKDSLIPKTRIVEEAVKEYIKNKKKSK